MNVSFQFNYSLVWELLSKIIALNFDFHDRKFCIQLYSTSFHKSVLVYLERKKALINLKWLDDNPVPILAAVKIQVAIRVI